MKIVLRPVGCYVGIINYEMHIQESQTPPNNSQQSKCSKMTEEGHHNRIGMNGIINEGNVGAAASEKNYQTSAATSVCPASSGAGGRLKFYKDGKFILELARAREGERVAWVSVPRKTFWPPAATASTVSGHRQESSTSLSVSDDNSSIQSSPWQRDHSWKQNTPRCNVSIEMTFFYHRPSSLQMTVAWRKRRRPFDSTPNINRCRKVAVEYSKVKVEVNDVDGANSDKKNLDGWDERDNGIVQSDSLVKKEETEVTEQCSINTKNCVPKSDRKAGEVNGDAEKSVPYRCFNKKLLRKRKPRQKLEDIVNALKNKKSSHVPNTNFTGPVLSATTIKSFPTTRHEQMVSPRKRILRELERVTIDDLSNKRSRPKPAVTVTTTQTVSFSSTSHNSSPSRAHNGSADDATVIKTSHSTSTKNASSYSITSLLGHHKKSDETFTTSPAHCGAYEYPNAQLSPEIRKPVPNSLSSSSSPSPKQHYSPKTIPAGISNTTSSHHYDSPDMSPSPEHYKYMVSQPVVRNSPTHHHPLSPPPELYKSYRIHSSPNHFSPPMQHISGMALHHQKTSPQYYTPSSGHKGPSQSSPVSSPHSPVSEYVNTPTSYEERYRKFVVEQRHESPMLDSEKRVSDSGNEMLQRHIINVDPTALRTSYAPYISPYVYSPVHVHPYINRAGYYDPAYRSPYDLLPTYPFEALPPRPPSPSQFRMPHSAWGSPIAAHTSALPSIHDVHRKDDSSDVPLNLSKNAG